MARRCMTDENLDNLTNLFDDPEEDFEDDFEDDSLVDDGYRNFPTFEEEYYEDEDLEEDSLFRELEELPETI